MDVLVLSINSCAFICNAFKAYLAGVIQEQNISDSSGYIASNPVMCPQTDNFVVRAEDIPHAIFSRGSMQRSSGSKNFIKKPLNSHVNICWFPRTACVS